MISLSAIISDSKQCDILPRRSIERRNQNKTGRMACQLRNKLLPPCQIVWYSGRILPEYEKQILSQGYQMTDKDNWLISANKLFWNKRISIALSYIPPISAGIRHNQQRMLETSLYQENTSRHLKSYNNMLLVKSVCASTRVTVNPWNETLSLKMKGRRKR